MKMAASKGNNDNSEIQTVQEWKNAQSRIKKIIANQRLLEKVVERSYNLDPETRARKKTEQAEQQIDRLRTILADSMLRKADYWELITPVYSSPKKPDLLEPDLLPEPKKPPEPSLYQLPSYKLKPLEPVLSIEDMEKEESQSIHQKPKEYYDSKWLLSKIRGNKKRIWFAAIVLTIIYLVV